MPGSSDPALFHDLAFSFSSAHCLVILYFQEEKPPEKKDEKEQPKEDEKKEEEKKEEPKTEEEKKEEDKKEEEKKKEEPEKEEPKPGEKSFDLFGLTPSIHVQFYADYNVIRHQPDHI